MKSLPLLLLIPGHSRTRPGATDLHGVSEYSRFDDLLRWYFDGRFYLEHDGVAVQRIDRPAYGSGRDSDLVLHARNINAARPHVWVELHFDIAASPIVGTDGKPTGKYKVNPLRRGSRGLFWPSSPTGRRVAEVAGRAWADGLVTREIAPEKRRDIYVLGHTTAPGALVETYFGSNASDTEAFTECARGALTNMVVSLVELVKDLADDGRLDLDPTAAILDDGRQLADGREVA